jgi:tRNA 2-thiouridine synthesizing protein A
MLCLERYGDRSVNTIFSTIADTHQDRGVEIELDACGLNCPLPVLRTKKTLDKMASGEVLQIIATDPGSVEDMAALARQTGHELVETRQESDKYYFVMRKG